MECHLHFLEKSVTKKYTFTLLKKVLSKYTKYTYNIFTKLFRPSESFEKINISHVSCHYFNIFFGFLLSQLVLSPVRIIYYFAILGLYVTDLRCVMDGFLGYSYILWHILCIYAIFVYFEYYHLV